MTTTPRVKPAGKCTTNAKPRNIKINDDSEDRKEEIASYIRSNHNLCVSLYKCGVSYGRMVESTQRALASLGLVVVLTVSILSEDLSWWPWVRGVLVLLWITELILLDIWTGKQVKRHIAEKIKKLEVLRDDELVDWEDK